jgi:hypothetical protein
MKSWIFLAAVSVNVIVNAIPLLLWLRLVTAGYRVDGLAPSTLFSPSYQQMTPSRGASHEFPAPATNKRSTLCAPPTRNPPPYRLEEPAHALLSDPTFGIPKQMNNHASTLCRGRHDILLVRLTHHRIETADDGNDIGQKAPFHQHRKSLQGDK